MSDLEVFLLVSGVRMKPGLKLLIRGQKISKNEAERKGE